MKGPGADSEEKHEPARDIDTVMVDGLKALDPYRPIREADMIPKLDLALVQWRFGSCLSLKGERRLEDLLALLPADAPIRELLDQRIKEAEKPR